MRVAVIFGGCGFIGIHFARHLLENINYNLIYLADIALVDVEAGGYRSGLLRDDRIKLVSLDVREEIEWRPPEHVELIANFAAIHREPGHHPPEYYHTNIKGAEHVCKWAADVCCESIIFTSSIAPYGSRDIPKSEDTLPVPDTPYGGSKLVAEKIHEVWQAQDRESRTLAIIRPGVVFGPSEGGNVTRMIKALKSNYFFYSNNKRVRKGGIYVKELVHIITWTLAEADKTIGLKSPVICNACMAESPELTDWVEAINSELGVTRVPLNVPISLLYIAAYLATAACRLVGTSSPLHPRRVAKLAINNDIYPALLAERSYKFRYRFEEALADWRVSCERDWI